MHLRPWVHHLWKNARIDEQLTKAREEFRVQGTISHCFGTLLHIESRTPCSVKLYVFDSDMEAQVRVYMRCCIMDGFDGEIVETIQRVLNQVNLFVEIFLRAGEFIGNQDVLTVRLANYETLRVDLRKNYHPPCKEVAAILLGYSMGAERNIILHQKGGRLQQVNERQPAYSTVHFPCCSNVVN